MKKLVIALMSIFLSVCTAWAQERPQADVQVRSVFVVRVAPPSPPTPPTPQPPAPQPTAPQLFLHLTPPPSE